MREREMARRILLAGHDVITSLCPRRWRFPYAVWLARLSGPVVYRSSLYQRPPLSLDTYHERTLSSILSRMERRGLPFDPVVTVRGIGPVPAGAAIIVSGHFGLNKVGLRWLHDRGHLLSLVTPHAWFWSTISGTRERYEIIDTDSMIFVRIRGHLAAGRKVGIEIDDFSPRAGARGVETPTGTVFVQGKIMQFATRLGVPIVFMATHFTRHGRIVIVSSTPSFKTPDLLINEFCQFLRDQFMIADI